MSWDKAAPRVASFGMLAVIRDVWFRPQSVGDFFLRTRCYGLVGLKPGDGRFIGSGNVVLMGGLEWERHGESFGR